jgi:lipopolysaccharide transport system permease protein
MGILSKTEAADSKQDNLLGAELPHVGESTPNDTADTAKPVPVVRIAPTSGWRNLQLRELWEYRELLFFFIWRDLKVKYRQTILGATWAILQPIVTMIVFTFVFGRIARINSDGIPYPIFSYTALVAWGFFAGSLGGAANSMVTSGSMIKKIYFPRLIVPIALSAATFVEFALSFSVLFVLMLVFGFVPTINIVFIPVLLLIAYVTGLGVGLWLSAMYVRFRDIRFLIPYMMQVWMFLSPIIYPISAIDDPNLRFVYSLNPMANVVQGFRWALLGADPPLVTPMIISTIAAIIILITGVFYFRRMEKTFADVV